VGIDPDGAADFRSLVREMNEKGRTVLMSTHLLYEIGMTCTHAAMIRGGKLLAQGSVDELSQLDREIRGYTYEIHVTSGGDMLQQEIKSLQEVREVTLSNNKLVVIAKTDIGSTLFSLANKGPYRVESLTPINPSWEDLYQFYQRRE